jgi:glycine/D-amino acid oxidase-like deaminating enzyme
MRVLIVGCGVVGAAIAYELSQRPDLEITVVDRQPAPPAHDQTTYKTSTGAALGVLMAAISTKAKGRNLRLKFDSINWYDRVIPQVEALTGLSIPVNRQGLLRLEFDADRLPGWAKLVTIRQTQNRRLEIWDPAQLQPFCHPQAGAVAGIYAPDDRQIDPVALTNGLIAAAKQRGVIFEFGVEVSGLESMQSDRVVIAAGLGSGPLTQALNQPLALKPVLGQAVHVRLPDPIGNPDFQPVITGHDIHLIPLGETGDYWIGATVEFEGESGEALLADADRFEQLMSAAKTFWPDLESAEVIRQWSGLRPRPEGQSAPVIQPLAGYDHILLATGHYRNGVLLAPATAMAVNDWLSLGM